MDAAIFPGQGAQYVGMGRDVAEASSAAADVFNRADRCLGIPLSRLCFEGPAERLNATDIQQPAIFVTSVALFRAATERGTIRPEQFGAMAGLSLGEYTALHLAGALDFEPALRLVYQRGRLMQQAAEQHPGGMVSVVGLDEDAVRALCAKVADRGRVAPANFNCPGQIVISGDLAACEAALEAVASFGGKAVALKVAGAFHSELMRSAAEGLRPELERCAFRAPATRVLRNVDGGYHGDAASIREALYRQVASPVRWQACVERMVQEGRPLAAWEIGPGRVLAGLMRKIDRSVPVTNIGGAADLAVPVGA